MKSEKDIEGTEIALDAYKQPRLIKSVRTPGKPLEGIDFRAYNEQIRKSNKIPKQT